MTFYGLKFIRDPADKDRIKVDSSIKSNYKVVIAS